MKQFRALALTLVLLSCTSAASAAPTPNQACDYARITAWKVYSSCIDTVVAKAAKGVAFDQWKALWKCRRSYFKKWAGFQTKASLATSVCVGNRYTDQSLTVLDNLTGLEWEKKTDDATLQDKDFGYDWGTSRANGTAFESFLSGPGMALNSVHLAATADWRMPELKELQSIMADYTCTGTGGSPTCTCTGPCVDAGFTALDPNMSATSHWTATTFVPFTSQAWCVDFSTGEVTTCNKATANRVRAVRGGF